MNTLGTVILQYRLFNFKHVPTGRPYEDFPFLLEFLPKEIFEERKKLLLNQTSKSLFLVQLTTTLTYITTICAILGIILFAIFSSLKYASYLYFTVWTICPAILVVFMGVASRRLRGHLMGKFQRAIDQLLEEFNQTDTSRYGVKWSQSPFGQAVVKISIYQADSENQALEDMLPPYLADVSPPQVEWPPSYDQGCDLGLVEMGMMRAPHPAVPVQSVANNNPDNHPSEVSRV